MTFWLGAGLVLFGVVWLVVLPYLRKRSPLDGLGECKEHQEMRWK